MKDESTPSVPMPPSQNHEGRWRGLYPFEPRGLSIGGHLLSYLDEGKGQPILFVHGNPTWSFAWREFVKSFRATHRCIAVDHLGCGLSDKPENYDYCLENHISNLVKLVETLDLHEITLVVHDWGGAIGLGALGRQPKRFAKVVITNTAAFPSPHIPLRIAACRLPVLGTIGVRGMNLFAGMATTMATERAEGLSPEVKAGYLAPYHGWKNRVAIDRFVKDIPMSPHHRSYKTLKEVEGALEVVKTLPTLIMWGMKDWCFSPWFYQQFCQRLPQARKVEFGHAGHYLFEDACEEMLAEMRLFLSR